ncbi:MAG: hypothetical protein QOG29_1543, partial [Gaiellaceae bacterium]|nr:hypothetical protein [Gaiellaceae bacterium]
MVDRFPSVLLRIEGLAVAAGALALYFHLGYGWILLVVLALAPDLSAAGYAFGPRVGAVAYDVAHCEALPILVGVIGILHGADGHIQVALIWLTHIGADRLLGYGLKYPSAFKDT